MQLRLYVLLVGVFTIIIAGARAMREMDIKKIIALSTLRQLGLIITTLGLGIYEVAFFHILTHAFFKALLFITVGNIIHMSSDYQDLRKIGLTESHYSTTLSFSLVANSRLCGLPFLAGFYSKDIILELSVIAPSNIVLMALFYLAVMLTTAYTVRFIALVLLGALKTSSFNAQDNDFLINSSIRIL